MILYICLHCRFASVCICIKINKQRELKSETKMTASVLCIVYVIINKRSFESFMCLDLIKGS